jgi:hypothetical protein
MKTSLDHLPLAKRRELEQAVTALTEWRKPSSFEARFAGASGGGPGEARFAGASGGGPGRWAHLKERNPQKPRGADLSAMACRSAC